MEIKLSDIKENKLTKPLVQILRYIEADLVANASENRPMDIPAYKAAVMALKSIGINHKYTSKYIDCYIEVQCQENESEGKIHDGFYHIEVKTRKNADLDRLTKLEKSEILDVVMDVFQSTILIDDSETFQFSVYLSNGEALQNSDSFQQGHFVISAEMISEKKLEVTEIPF
jgi:hypothetical protein